MPGGDLVPLDSVPTSATPANVPWPAGLAVRRRYATPHGDVFAGVGAHGEVPEDADNLVHVVGEGVPASWLPLGPHQKVSGGRLWAKRATLHAGASGQVGAFPVRVHQSRRAGWALSARKRAARLVFGSESLELRHDGDDVALLTSGSAVKARFRVQAGLTNELPVKDLSGDPLVCCPAESTPEEIALYILIAECELPEEASHPLMILLDIGL